MFSVTSLCGVRTCDCGGEGGGGGWWWNRVGGQAWPCKLCECGVFRHCHTPQQLISLTQCSVTRRKRKGQRDSRRANIGEGLELRIVFLFLNGKSVYYLVNAIYACAGGSWDRGVDLRFSNLFY